MVTNQCENLKKLRKLGELCYENVQYFSKKYGNKPVLIFKNPVYQKHADSMH